MNAPGTTTNRAVLLPINMGNDGQNHFPPHETFDALRRHSQAVTFIAYYGRRSGNFVFIDSGEAARRVALEAGKAVMGLTCLVRKFSDLHTVNRSVPPQTSTTSRRSVILPTPTGEQKLIHVALSHNIADTDRNNGTIKPRVAILSWPTPQDVLCAHDRPKQGGDVGQATNAVLAVLRKNYPDIYGTGRALSVLRGLLENRDMHYG